MLTYEELKRQPRKLLAQTSLTVTEYEKLLPVFEKAYLKKYPAKKTKTGNERKRKAGAGRKSSLDRIEQKLLFAVVYQKSYLKQALDDLGVLPERNPKNFKAHEENLTDAKDSIIDGTERRRQRPKQSEKQALHYSGKKKAHTDKNVIIATAKKKRVSFLSKTYPGKTHDKKVADCENIVYPPHVGLHKDTGFQGYEPNVRKTYQPKKSLASRN